MARTEDAVPRYCPHCLSERIYFAVEWVAMSLDPTDRDNTCEVEEWQCHGCDRSFWV